VIEQQLGVAPTPVLDTLLMHRLAEPELPHGLGFVGTRYTDVHAWKAGKIATHADTDKVLWHYCAIDVAVNSRILKPMAREVAAKGQSEVLTLDHDVQAACRAMHRVGLFIDQGLDAHGRPTPVPTKPDGTPDTSRFGRAHWAEKLVREAEEAAEYCRTLLGNSDFNPGSTEQLRRVLFDTWGFIPVSLTAGLDPTTADGALRHYIQDAGIPKEQREFVQSVRIYRRRVKYLGYVKSVRMEVGEPGVCMLHDGRAHPHWNATGRGSGDDGGTTSGRLTSSPNFQNWPYKLRSMVQAQPGHVLVGADGDQIELRYVAALAGCTAYLEIFARGLTLPPQHPEGDPHRYTAAALFTNRFTKADGQPTADANGVWSKGTGTVKKLRDMAKRFTYLCLYGGSAETAWKNLIGTEDDAGKLIYADVTLRQVRVLHDRFMAANPEIRQWHQRTEYQFARDDYLTEAVSGRRRDFADGGKINELVNFPVQGGCAGLMNLAIVAANRRWPAGFAGPGTGLCGQFHDALMLEVPEAMADQIRVALTELMTQTVPAFPGMVFTAEAAAGQRWGET